MHQQKKINILFVLVIGLFYTVNQSWIDFATNTLEINQCQVGSLSAV